MVIYTDSIMLPVDSPSNVSVFSSNPALLNLMRR